jgi:VWFA-related protein
MTSKILIALLTIAVPLCAQDAAVATDEILTIEDPELITFSTEINVVSIPVVVTGPDGVYVHGLEKSDFTVIDNGVEQQILEFDVSFQPISMVICVQTSDRAETMLDQLQKTAYLFTESVLGEFGQTAIIGFDSRIKILSEFTNDPKKIDRTLTNLKIGANGIRVSDAVYEGMRMLLRQPETHKRVVVVISEGQDNGSQIRLGETIRTAQLNGIQVYPIYLSTLKSRLKDPPLPPSSPYPPGISPLPATPGTVSTPTTQQQNRYAATPNMIPLVMDLVVGVKNLVFRDALAALSVGTGGRTFKPMTDEGLQESIVKVGEDLHSQYLLTYIPNNLNDQGIYHEVEIRVPYSNAEVRYRPGYLYGPRPVVDGDPAP